MTPAATIVQLARATAPIRLTTHATVRVGQPVAALTVVLPAPRPNLHVTPATIVQLARATAHMRPTTVVTGKVALIVHAHVVLWRFRNLSSLHALHSQSDVDST